jgi:hypothetical protein
MKKGQIYVEAMIAMLFLLCFLELAISLLEARENRQTEAGAIFKAENNAQKCALIVNSLFSNTGTELKQWKSECSAEKEFEIKSLERTAFSIARNVKTVKKGSQTVLEVKTSDHYG